MDDLDPRKILFCAMVACTNSDELRKDLVNLYDLLVNSNKFKTGFEDIKNTLDGGLAGFAEFQKSTGGESIPPEAIEDLNKAAAAYVWCYRIHYHVEEYIPLFAVLESASDFNAAINGTNEFLEKNQ